MGPKCGVCCESFSSSFDKIVGNLPKMRNCAISEARINEIVILDVAGSTPVTRPNPPQRLWLTPTQQALKEERQRRVLLIDYWFPMFGERVVVGRDNDVVTCVFPGSPLFQIDGAPC
jgi:hypothetical protein